MISEDMPAGQPGKHSLPTDLEQRLNAFADDRQLSNAQLGQMLGVHSSVASKIRRGRYDVPIEPEMVAKVEDLLKAAARQKSVEHALFPTPIARSIASTLETIRATNDFALISSDAGLGKTAGIAIYCQTHPLAISVTATKWGADASAMEARLFEQIDSRAWKLQCRRGEFLAQRLEGSDRLLIVDNAHRLTRGGLAFLFDLHDRTRCPVALVGNPEVLDSIKGNDQWFSRIGLHRKLSLRNADAMGIVTELVQQLIPEVVGEAEALTLLEAIAMEPERGHFRSAKKTLLLARQIREGVPGWGWARAIRAAHTQQPRGYDLPTE